MIPKLIIKDCDTISTFMNDKQGSILSQCVYNVRNGKVLVLLQSGMVTISSYSKVLVIILNVNIFECICTLVYKLGESIVKNNMVNNEELVARLDSIIL